MGRERDVYADKRHFSDLAYSWEACCRDFFIDGDFHSRPWAEVHSIVREVLTPDWANDPPQLIHYLYAPAERVRRRLHLKGYTPSNIRELWEKAYLQHVQRMHDLSRHVDDAAFRKRVEEMAGLTFEAWAENEEKDRSFEEVMQFGGVLEIDLMDSYASLALHIDVREPEAVWINLTDLYDDYFDPTISVRENLDLIDEQFETIEVSGNTLVLTEGVSDARILKTAIASMYPEYADMFEFIDFDEFKVEGGASVLARLVKAFAGVRMHQRIVAIFDNDAAGQEARASLAKVRFPPSIRTMLLPDAEIARRYPTIGPEGLRVMDVNGSACSIEMFLGAEALIRPDGKLRALRWTGWNARAQRYQGEIDGKADVPPVFLRLLNETPTPEDRRARFPEMNMLLKSIFESFTKP